MRKYFCLSLILAFSHTAFSQSDSVLFAAATLPRTASNAGDPLFYGPQYVEYPYIVKGIAFYATAEWQKGTIIYREVAYQDVMLKYDLVKDEVMVQHLNGYTPVVLFTPRIHSFTLGEKRFVYLSSDEAAPFKAGIYEEMIAGTLTLYARRSKLMHEMIVSNALEREFVDNHSFYIRKKGGALAAVKKESALLEFAGDKKREGKALLKKAGIKFRKDPEEALRLIVNLSNQSSR